MTSQERVVATLNHRQPDQVPIDLSAHRSSGMAAIAYPKVRKALGLEPRTIYVYDPVQQLAIMDEDVLERFGIDVTEIGRAFCHDEKWWVDWTLPDGTPCKMPSWSKPERKGTDWVVMAPAGHVMARMPELSVTFEQAYWPRSEERRVGKECRSRW